MLAWQERDASQKGNESAEANTRSAEARGSTRKRQTISSQFGLLILITAQMYIYIYMQIQAMGFQRLIWCSEGFRFLGLNSVAVKTREHLQRVELQRWHIDSCRAKPLSCCRTGGLYHCEQQSVHWPRCTPSAGIKRSFQQSVSFVQHMWLA